jgi:hypothetical protein
MITYGVRLHPAAREPWRALVNTGRAAAVKLLQARIWLNADVGAERRHWTDAAVADALDPRASTVHRVRQACVEQGMEVALARQCPTGRQYRQLEGAPEAQLLAVACSAPPTGRGRWTLP